MSEYPKGATINQWSACFADAGQQKLADLLYDDKLVGIDALDKLGLPGPQGVMVTAAEYLTDPNRYFESLDSDRVYLNIIPRSGDLKKFSAFDITKAEGIAYIEQHLPAALVDEYFIGVYEYHPNVYGGSVLVNPNGHVLMEFGEGSNQEYTRGSSVPKFAAMRDVFTGVFHYNYDEVELREMAWRTMQYIPHSGEGVDMQFTAGYYEIAVYRDKQGTLQTIFLDYKDNPVYQLYDEQTV
jgi:hypothetical protein